MMNEHHVDLGEFSIKLESSMRELWQKGPSSRVRKASLYLTLLDFPLLADSYEAHGREWQTARDLRSGSARIGSRLAAISFQIEQQLLAEERTMFVETEKLTREERKVPVTVRARPTVASLASQLKDLQLNETAVIEYYNVDDAQDAQVLMRPVAKKLGWDFAESEEYRPYSTQVVAGHSSLGVKMFVTRHAPVPARKHYPKKKGK